MNWDEILKPRRVTKKEVRETQQAFEKLALRLKKKSKTESQKRALDWMKFSSEFSSTD